VLYNERSLNEVAGYNIIYIYIIDAGIFWLTVEMTFKKTVFIVCVPKTDVTIIRITFSLDLTVKNANDDMAWVWIIDLAATRKTSTFSSKRLFGRITCFGFLWQSLCIQRRLSSRARTMLVTCIIFARLDYCNAMFTVCLVAISTVCRPFGM